MLNKIYIIILLFTCVNLAQDNPLWLIGMMSDDGVTTDTLTLTYPIDNDFELSDLIADDFTADITGWAGVVSTAFHYDSDWNSLVGYVDEALMDSATGTSNAYVVFATSMVSGRTYKLLYDYYVPSGNTTVDGIRPRFVGATNDYLTNRTTADAWTSVSETIIATSGYTTLRFYLTDGAANTPTVEDLIYLDNVYLTEFPNYTATGNHSFDSTTTAITGSYSGLIAATGAGDATTNYATLTDDFFTALVEGDSTYVYFNGLASTTGVNVTMVIGGQSKTWTGVDNASEELLEWTFLTSAAEVGEDILIYLNKTASLTIDDFGN